jgi:predicted PhzF superfamily epimerase YddE/YHI9
MPRASRWSSPAGATSATRRSAPVPRPAQIEVRVPRVFCDSEGRFGNELGVVLDGTAVPDDDRQAIATRLAYAETVFVDDPAEGRFAIYTPETELPFAGHPTVGTAWVLAQAGYEVDSLRPPAGKVGVRRDGEMTWVSARPEWCPPFELRQLADAGEIDALPVLDSGFIYAWAWIDEDAGLIRARSFVPEVGVAEDEATGSAALRVCAEVGRPIEVRQGRGSVIWAQPIDDGFVEIGGFVVED